MSANGQQIVDWIEKYKGQRDNSGAFMWKLAGFPTLAGSAWCGATVLASHNAFGIDMSDFLKPIDQLYVPNWVRAARNHKIWIPSVQSKVGYPIIYDWDGHQDSAANNADHIGTAVHNTASLSYLTSIGGNTSDGVNPNLQRGVFERRRPRTQIMGAVDISAWLSKGGGTPIPTSKKVAVDGTFGNDSTRLLEQLAGVKVDYSLSGQLSSIRGGKAKAATLDQCWPTIMYSAGGSRTVAWLQKVIGVKQDGYFGPKTIRALQKFLKVKVDGLPGPKTVKALQRWMNKEVGA